MANEEQGKVFGHIALAAPDVDASTFSALLPSVIRQAEHVTFYYCESDRALRASRAIHVDKPVGLVRFSPMDSIRSTPTRSIPKFSDMVLCFG